MKINFDFTLPPRYYTNVNNSKYISSIICDMDINVCKENFMR
jgi:hypothetical protein